MIDKFQSGRRTGGYTCSGHRSDWREWYIRPHSISATKPVSVPLLLGSAPREVPEHLPASLPQRPAAFYLLQGTSDHLGDCHTRVQTATRESSQGFH